MAEETEAGESHPAEEGEGMNILIATNTLSKTEQLVQLALNIRRHKPLDKMYALNIINKQEAPDESDKHARKMLQLATQTGASADIEIEEVIRYDTIINGISGEIKAKKITDLIMGYSTKPYSSDKSFHLINGILTNEQITTYVYNPVQPISTIKKNIVVIPPHAEKESGFYYWLSNLWTLAKNCGGGVKFFAAAELEPFLKHLMN
ncbi:hypothetical protein [Niabella hibiscisoli]|uniref:hypothetical protein n=1 Tax=Niabella hibiscisoli TaxID=1825928 RepID=UPI001F0EF575|nr:hypothetical protein [Niabella hibiscisoli]MCH5718766.1 hypothetical protein [Niabella hibiscisoli]